MNKNYIQRIGRFLSSMIMPNIGVFITWGLITAIFLPSGWLPNETMSELSKPMVRYLLPILIGYTGGKLIYDHRGGTVAAVATFGLIIGVEVPMFIGAMIIGPMSALILKHLDRIIEKKTPVGFEMLIQNFTTGILGLVLALASYTLIGPLFDQMIVMFEKVMARIVEVGLLPFSSLIIEPGKILFLNNAINHGVLSPVGIHEASLTGSSILFLLETNPGPGLGILLSYWFYGKGIGKETTPSAMIIHFFGGIHEVYFPYILAKPILIIPTIIGSFSGIFVFTMFDVGLTATPSPGSIFSIMTLTPKGEMFGVILGILVSIIVTFALAIIFGMKEKKLEDEKTNLEYETINKIAFACDSGMGSSAMGVNAFVKQIGNRKEVIYCEVNHIPEDVDLIITHKSLLDRVQHDGIIIGVTDFINNDKINAIAAAINSTTDGGTEEMFFKKREAVLKENMIFTNQKSVTKKEAIIIAGTALHEAGLVEKAYIDGMLAREEITSTYIGSNVAIPHGSNTSKMYVNTTGIVVYQYPDGIDFGDGNIAKLVIGIAAKGDEHMDILMKIAEAVGDETTLNFLTTEENPELIYNTLAKNGLGGK